MSEEVLLFLNYVRFPQYFFLMVIINAVVCLFCIYMLVGSRLLFIVLSPSDYELLDGKYKSIDLREFIPLRASKKKYLSLIKKIKAIATTKSMKSSNKNLFYCDSRNDNNSNSNPNTMIKDNYTLRNNNSTVYFNNLKNNSGNNNMTNTYLSNNSATNTYLSNNNNNNVSNININTMYNY